MKAIFCRKFRSCIKSYFIGSRFNFRKTSCIQIFVCINLMRFLIQKRFFNSLVTTNFYISYSNELLLYAEQYCLVVIFSLVFSFWISILFKLMVFYENILSVFTIIIDVDGNGKTLN